MMNMMNDQGDEHGLVDLLNSCPCCLCGNRATVRVVFTPDAALQYLYGAPAGKTRKINYGLCDKCFARGPEIIPEADQGALSDVGWSILN